MRGSRFFKPTLCLVLPVAGWIAAVHARAHVIKLSCLDVPTPCLVSNVNFIDKVAFRFQDSICDDISLWMEIVMGCLMLLIPLALYVYELRVRKSETVEPFRKLCSAIWFIFVVAAWNGFCTELVRLSAQRPRPFVYTDPGVLGANPAHYTSFYSGHTSFTVAIAMGLILLLRSKRLSPVVMNVSSVILIAVALTTGVCRVLSARHFPSDVFGACIGGSLVAYLVWMSFGNEMLIVEKSNDLRT